MKLSIKNLCEIQDDVEKIYNHLNNSKCPEHLSKKIEDIAGLLVQLDREVCQAIVNLEKTKSSKVICIKTKNRVA